MSRSTPITPESWETLLEAVRETEEDLAGVAPFRDTLAGAHARALALKAVRDVHEAAIRKIRDSHRAAMLAGKDAAIALRGFVQSVLGTRNEKLRLYGLKPKGRRRKVRKKPGPSACPGRKRACGKAR